MDRAFAISSADQSGYNVFVSTYLGKKTDYKTINFDALPDAKTAHTYLNRYIADEENFDSVNLWLFMRVLYEQQKTHLLGANYPYWAGFSMAADNDSKNSIIHRVIGANNNFDRRKGSNFYRGLKDGNQRSDSPKQALYLVRKKLLTRKFPFYDITDATYNDSYYGYALHIETNGKIYVTSGCQEDRAPATILRYWLSADNDNPLHRAMVMAHLLLDNLADISDDPTLPKKTRSNASRSLKAAFNIALNYGLLEGPLPDGKAHKACQNRDGIKRGGTTANRGYPWRDYVPWRKRPKNLPVRAI